MPASPAKTRAGPHKDWTAKTLMESILWALDLLAVVYLCFWALREDKKPAAGEDGKLD
jgi:hypothetical protein